MVDISQQGEHMCDNHELCNVKKQGCKSANASHCVLHYCCPKVMIYCSFKIIVKPHASKYPYFVLAVP